jgi:hypothetical protein
MKTKKQRSTRTSVILKWVKEFIQESDYSIKSKKMVRWLVAETRTFREIEEFRKRLESVMMSGQIDGLQRARKNTFYDLTSFAYMRTIQTYIEHTQPKYMSRNCPQAMQYELFHWVTTREVKMEDILVILYLYRSCIDAHQNIVSRRTPTQGGIVIREVFDILHIKLIEGLAKKTIPFQELELCQSDNGFLLYLMEELPEAMKTQTQVEEKFLNINTSKMRILFSHIIDYIDKQCEFAGRYKNNSEIEQAFRKFKQEMETELEWYQKRYNEIAHKKQRE